MNQCTHLKISAAWLRWSFSSSGAMYTLSPSENPDVEPKIVEMPKSTFSCQWTTAELSQEFIPDIFNVPSNPTRMFSGLMSKCITLFACMWCSPCMISGQSRRRLHLFILYISRYQKHTATPEFLLMDFQWGGPSRKSGIIPSVCRCDLPPPTSPGWWRWRGEGWAPWHGWSLKGTWSGGACSILASWTSWWHKPCDPWCWWPCTPSQSSQTLAHAPARNQSSVKRYKSNI